MFDLSLSNQIASWVNTWPRAALREHTTERSPGATPVKNLRGMGERILEEGQRGS